MNTERTPYRPEDDDSEDSSAVSFGSGGPAFRPIPRIERPAPPPVPEKAPRLPEGLLFERISEAQAAKKSAESEKDDEEDDEEEKPAVQPAATSHHEESKHAVEPTSQLPEHSPAAGPQESSTAEADHTLDGHLPDIGEFNSPLPDVVIPAPRLAPDQLGHAPAFIPASESHGFESPPATSEHDNTEDDKHGQPATAISPLSSPNSSTPHTTEASVPATAHEASDDDGNQAHQTTYAASMGAVGTSGRGSTGGGGGQPPVPPGGHSAASPNFGGGQPPSNYNMYGGGGGGYNYNAAPVSPAPSPEAPAVGGAPAQKHNIWPYVAVLGENIARKRADRKLKKELGSRIDTQAKAQERTDANQLRLEKRQQQLINEQQAAQSRRQHRGEWGVPVTAPYQAEPMPGASGHRHPGERPATMGQPEFRAPTGQEQMAESIEPIPLQPHQRVEHSAWHSIVVNEKGQEVAGAVQYGEGFKRERQQEVIRDRTGDSAVAGVAGAASVAGATGGLGGSSPYGAGSSYPHTLPSGMTTPGLPQGTPTHANPQHQLPPHAKKSGVGLPGPLFWLMVGLIIAAFFAASLI